MSDLRQRIAQNVAAVRQAIAEAAQRAGRPPGAIRLVAVTKAVGLAEAEILRDLGVTDLGENRVEDARAKVETLRTGVCWHMIGTVQRRKARGVVTWFDTVDAVDRLSLAEALQRRCEEQDRRLRVLIEVNVSGETSKHGLEPDTLASALHEIRAYDRLTVEGLMTIAPFGAEPDILRSIFRRLRQSAEEHGLPELSMGMTDDFEIAIEEGATQVRIGRALFT